MVDKNLPSTVDRSLIDKPSNPLSVFLTGDFLRENILILFFGFLGLILLCVGIISLFLDSQPKESGIIIEERVEDEVGKIKVDIEGAVVRPGVYELDTSSRVQEALILARGLSSLADRDWMAKNLNLAAKLTDGAKIYIPQEGEVKGSGSGGAFTASGQEVNYAEKININSASSKELKKLSGVGPVTAQKIIDGRPYQEIENLRDNKIVGASVF